MKRLNYLNAGIGLLIVDVVPERRANLHDEMMTLIVGHAPPFPGTPATYAAAYRPCRRGGQSQRVVCPLTVGESLPVLPLWLRAVEKPHSHRSRSGLHGGAPTQRARLTEAEMG
ncbi:MAG: hypothetical protein JNM56_33135 [Planctomycetia bacterium]|nr:hypothetical protein [Planctomycetia bacterium]